VQLHVRTGQFNTTTTHDYLKFIFLCGTAFRFLKQRNFQSYNVSYNRWKSHIQLGITVVVVVSSSRIDEVNSQIYLECGWLAGMVNHHFVSHYQE
jgi:hypothetical protein